MSETRAALRLVEVVKTYPGVTALAGVSLEFAPGEVHALVGENGAGKSTLMGVAAGSIVPDSGSVEVGGRSLDEPSPAKARELGLAVVYQHHTVLEELTVAENLAFSMPPGRRPRWSRLASWAEEQLAVVDAQLEPHVRVSELSVAEHQLLEIARALALQSRVLLLDEPTESLTAAESELLFERIANMTTSGTAVVYVSHRLREVARIADRITVLRDGEVRGSFRRGETDEAEILKLVAGREIDRIFPARPADVPAGRVIVDVRNLSGDGFRGVDMQVHQGEILGLAGVEGNGQREFLRALAGMQRVHDGDVLLDGEPLRLGDPRRALAAGVVHLPGDRHREGLLLSLSVRENITLLALDTLARFGIVQAGAQAALAAERVEALGVRTPSIETLVESLSGGNQQKVLIGRSMLASPTVLLADEPTRGVDMGARVDVYQLLRDGAGAGQGIVMCSSDALELQGMCDRVLVFSRGRIVQELQGVAITEQAITSASVTADVSREEAAGRDRQSTRLRRFLAGDYAPSLVLGILVVLLALYVGGVNDRFLSELNLQGMLLLASALIFVSLGQQVVVLAAGFDLSVGPLTGITVIILSFLTVAGADGLSFALALPAIIALGVVVGLANGFLVRVVKLAPVLATLASLFVLQGVALLMRPLPGGFVDRSLTDMLKVTLGPVPVAFVVAMGTTIVAEFLLRRSRAGLELRAVGSNEERARRLGARVNGTQFGAYVACSLLAVMGGVMLASQVGIGDATLGGNYTLASITAVVLGGASLFGGRGSFVGAFMGALLIQEIITSTAFLRLGQAWQFWLPGILVLVAAAIFSRARRVRGAGLAGGAG
jgi:ribose transport system ATP-binding protein